MHGDLLNIKNHLFKTIVAVTSEEHMRGLMGRAWPPPVMAFPYDKSEYRKFWMKNCISPLDIVFCNNNKIVDICYGEPMSTKLIGPYEPVDLVVEFPHGTAEKCGFFAGDVVQLKLSSNTAARILKNGLIL